MIECRSLGQDCPMRLRHRDALGGGSFVRDTETAGCVDLLPDEAASAGFPPAVSALLRCVRLPMASISWWSMGSALSTHLYLTPTLSERELPVVLNCGSRPTKVAVATLWPAFTSCSQTLVRPTLRIGTVDRPRGKGAWTVMFTTYGWES